VAAGFAMDRGHGTLKFYSFHNDKWVLNGLIKNGLISLSATWDNLATASLRPPNSLFTGATSNFGQKLILRGPHRNQALAVSHGESGGMSRFNEPVGTRRLSRCDLIVERDCECKDTLIICPFPNFLARKCKKLSFCYLEMTKQAVQYALSCSSCRSCSKLWEGSNLWGHKIIYIILILYIFFMAE